MEYCRRVVTAAKFGCSEYPAVSSVSDIKAGKGTTVVYWAP